MSELAHEHKLVISTDEFYEYVSCESCPCVWKRTLHGKCYECHKPMPAKDDGWHEECWKEHKLNKMVDEDCS